MAALVMRSLRLKCVAYAYTHISNDITPAFLNAPPWESQCTVRTVTSD